MRLIRFMVTHPLTTGVGVLLGEAVSLWACHLLKVWP